MTINEIPGVIPRLAEEYPFPEYAYVPGHHPHPIRDPAGHSYGHDWGRVLPLTPDTWRSNRLYAFGIDLFNHGYYWESHEAWEEIWHKSGHSTTEGLFLKSLIKLSAAGVKVRENMMTGVKTHAGNACEGFEQVRSEVGKDNYMGLSLAGLITFAWKLETNPPRSSSVPTEREIVFSTPLEPF